MKTIIRLSLVIMIVLSLVQIGSAAIAVFNGSSGWQNTSNVNVSIVPDTNNIELNDTNPALSKWRFDNNSVKSNNATYHGTNNGAIYNASGKYGQTFNFDNTISDVNIGDIDYVDNLIKLSVCAWVRLNSSTDDDVIISKINTNYAGGFMLFRDDVSASSGRTDVYRFIVWLTNDATKTAYIETPSSSTPLNVWTHLCGVFNASDATTGLRLFVNGTEVAGSPVSTALITGISASAGSLRIGELSFTGSNFNGQIDDVRMYDNLLTLSQIQQISNNSMLNSGNLTAWHDFGLDRQGRRAMTNFTNLDANLTAKWYASSDNITFNYLEPVINATWSSNFASGDKNQTQYVRLVFNGNITNSPEAIELRVEDEALVISGNPNITSWSPTTLNQYIELFNTQLFSAVANQTIDIWNWFLNGTDKNNNYDNLSYSFNNTGYYILEVNATNTNGTSNTIQWNNTIKQAPEINVSMVIS